MTATLPLHPRDHCRRIDHRLRRPRRTGHQDDRPARPTADADWDEARSPGTWPSTSTRPPSRSPRRCRDVAEPSRRARTRPARSRRRAPATTPRRSSALERRRPAPDRPAARGRRSTRGRHRPRRRRRAVGRGRRPRRAEHGLAALAGSSPDVGVAGYTLGGGLSWLGPHARSRRRAASPRSRSSPPTACTVASAPTATPSCSGRCAAAAATSAWSPRWSSSCPDHRGLRRRRCSSRSSARRGAQGLARVGRRMPDEVTSVGRMLRFPPLPDLPDRSCGQVVRGRRGASTAG